MSFSIIECFPLSAFPTGSYSFTFRFVKFVCNCFSATLSTAWITSLTSECWLKRSSRTLWEDGIAALGIRLDLCSTLGVRAIHGIHDVNYGHIRSHRIPSIPRQFLHLDFSRYSERTVRHTTCRIVFLLFFSTSNNTKQPNVQFNRPCTGDRLSLPAPHWYLPGRRITYPFGHPTSVGASLR